jgi:tetratricopeptide (TPR) repeat protein
MMISEALQLAKTDDCLSETHFRDCLEALSQHECWTMWLDVLDRHSRAFPSLEVDDLLAKAGVYLNSFEDFDSVAASLRQILSKSSMNFKAFREQILLKLIDAEEFKTEGKILQAIEESFQSNDDKIEAIERLCYIYEKKVHNEALINRYYEVLLSLDSSNSKALKFFRTLNTQLEDWPAVVNILKQLLHHVKHPQEGFRYAQELAAVYLYQLNEPEAAINILEEYCANSPLDTSTIHYEAYLKLKRLDGCLKVLRSCLLNVEDTSVRAVIHFRIGLLFDELEDLKMARENYQKCIDFEGDFLEAYEGLIGVALKNKDWQEILRLFNHISSVLFDSTLKEQIDAGCMRLTEGIQSKTTSQTVV